MTEPKRRGRPPKARVEGAAVQTAPHKSETGLAGIVEAFKADHADLWAEIALCPLQHGLDAMIERLK